MCILVLISALLDAIASVAASVIFSRLLISGDGESNPGPGELSFSLIGMQVAPLTTLREFQKLIQNLITAMSMLFRY